MADPDQEHARRLIPGLLVAVASCALATAVCWAASLQGKPGPGAIFLVTVCLSAYAGGLWAGLGAAALSYLAASWLFIDPPHSLALNVDKGVFGGALVLASVPIVALLERERRLRRELEAGSASLAREIEERRGADERDRFLAEATEALNSSLDIERTQEELGDLAVPAIADWCRIELTTDRLDAASAAAGPGQPVERGSLDARAIETVTTKLARELAAPTARPELYEQLGADSLSALVVPLFARDRPVGTATFVRERPRRPHSDADIRLATELGRLAAMALDNARLHRAAELARVRAETAAGRAQRLQTVIDAAFASSSSEEFLDQLLERLREAIGADTATILTVAEGETLEVRRAVGYAEPADAHVPFGSGFAGRIASSRSHQVSVDLDASEFAISSLADAGVVTAAGAPLIADGTLVGVLQVGCKHQRTFDDEDVMLLRLVAARAAIALERAQLYERGQSVAEGLQRSLLPSRFPAIDGFEAAARYIPGTLGLEVGGDWYDIFELEDGSIAISVGDVMGRGIHAAATMSQLRNVLRAYALEGLAPGETLGRLNHLATESEIYATVVYAIVSPTRESMRIANAGHPPPLSRAPHGRAQRIVEGASPPIGALPETTFRDAELALAPRSSLVFYTDGLVERRGESIDASIDRLAEIVGGSDEPVHQLIDLILDGLEVDDHPDDRALLVVSFGHSSADRLCLRFPPEPRALATARRGLRSWLRERDADEREIFDIVFAVNEACSNAIEHPLDVQDDEIELKAELTDGRVTIIVNDNGRWKTESNSRYRGRGLDLMHAVMENVDVIQSSDGTSIRLERAISRRAGDIGTSSTSAAEATASVDEPGSDGSAPRSL